MFLQVTQVLIFSSCVATDATSCFELTAAW